MDFRTSSIVEASQPARLAGPANAPSAHQIHCHAHELRFTSKPEPAEDSHSSNDPTSVYCAT